VETSSSDFVGSPVGTCCGFVGGASLFLTWRWRLSDYS